MEELVDFMIVDFMTNHEMNDYHFILTLTGITA